MTRQAPPAGRIRGGLFVYRFGPFELDAANRRLFRDSIRVRVSGPQLAILTHLVLHPDVTMSKDTLVNVGWGGQAVSDNSLEQAIHRLRKLLGDGVEGSHYIERVPHRGYRLGVPVVRVTRDASNDPLDTQLEPFLASVHGRMQLDTLDRGEIRQAREGLESVLREAPDNARAHALLAMACGLAFESTALETCPDTATLTDGIAHARRGCELAPDSGEAWSTLAFVLGLGGSTAHAVAAAHKALVLEPENWRHALRLARVASGEERMQAASRVLALYPELALAHWLRGTVFVARSALDAARGELQLGCAAQDAQTKGYPFPAVGLHLLHGLVCAAQGRLDDGESELTRELPSAECGQIYARECAANTWYALGAFRLRQRRAAEAAIAFGRALAIAPAHVPAHAALRGEIPASASGIDRALGEAIILARGNRHEEAARVYREGLAQQPPGAAGWILPVEPILNPLARGEAWAETLALVRVRAT
jgi:DNA-binding winged helix-turn-helix (wHTH) protein